MEAGQVTESGERETATMSAARDVAVRRSAPPPPHSMTDRSIDSDAQDASRPGPSDVWAGAISKLQNQVSLNTSMLESHRQKVQEIEGSINRLNYDLGSVMTTLQDIRSEMRTNKPSAEPTRHEIEDLEVLVGQVQAVTSKANEVDALRLQIELLKNRMKRYDEQGSPAVPPFHSRTASSHREPSFHEGGLPSQPSEVSRPLPKASQPQTLPPMRTTAISSPMETRPSPHNAPPMLESQNGQGYRPPSDPRQFSGGSSATVQASSGGSYRPGEPLPPPSALSGWRPAESMSHIAPPPPPSVRHHAIEPEPHATGWAAVNATQTAKRPFEEHRQSPYESPGTDSPKRPKLAPIMPRSAYPENSSYVPSTVTQSATADSPLRNHSRVPSDGSQPHAQPLPTSAAANAAGHRFIISTQSADSQDSWRPESERIQQMHGRGSTRGRGSRSRGRVGRGGRGGAVGAPESAVELATPEWEKPDWTGSQISPNGYYNPLHRPHQSPNDAARGGLMRQSADQEGEFPATPLAVQGPYDPFTAGHPESSGGQPTSGGKKTRTKPMRNAEGILIRKDGRPDMRSVSSANNLRKVHAKKEAERAELEGRTPTSARSLAPAGSLSDEEDEPRSGSPITPADDGEAQDTQQRHRELMSRIFPQGGGSKSAGERFFPLQDTSESEMKTEPGSEEPATTTSTLEKEGGGGSQMTDAVMKEMSEEERAGRQQPPDDEASETQ